MNPSRLRQAESKALVAKSPAAYLLNKVLDLIFTEQELAASKGVRSLDAHKMEAVSGEILFVHIGYFSQLIVRIYLCHILHVTFNFDSLNYTLYKKLCTTNNLSFY